VLLCPSVCFRGVFETDSRRSKNRGGAPHYFSAVTLNIGTGRWNPFSTASPAGSALTAGSILPYTRWETRTWPAFASVLRRAGCRRSTHHSLEGRGAMRIDGASGVRNIHTRGIARRSMRSISEARCIPRFQDPFAWRAESADPAPCSPSWRFLHPPSKRSQSTSMRRMPRQQVMQSDRTRTVRPYEPPAGCGR
jgi:hypothetical protein